MWPWAMLVLTTALALFSTAFALRLLARAASIDAAAASRLPLAETLAGSSARTVATVATLAQTVFFLNHGLSSPLSEGWPPPPGFTRSKKEEGVVVDGRRRGGE